jgi:hypothetical protein
LRTTAFPAARAELPACHRQREIPRRNRADDTVGLGDDHAEAVPACRHKIAAIFVGELRKEADLFRRDGDVAMDELADGARGRHCLQPCKRFGFRLDQVSPTMHQPYAFARANVRPAAFLQGAFACLHGLIDQIGIGYRTIGKGDTVGRALHGKRTLGCDQPAANEMAMGQHDGVGIEAERHEVSFGFQAQAEPSLYPHAVCFDCGVRRDGISRLPASLQRNLRPLR